jgi:hypothetical protein
MPDENPTSDEKAEVLAFYGQVLQDIRDIKARAWKFITILIAITGGVLALNIRSGQELVFVVVVVAAISTFFISTQSFSKLYASRTRLEQAIEKMPAIKGLRDKARGDDVRGYDIGDYWFLVLGILAPLLSLILAFCQLFSCCTCRSG